jgi:hypothetical protein
MKVFEALSTTHATDVAKQAEIFKRNLKSVFVSPETGQG